MTKLYILHPERPAEQEKPLEIERKFVIENLPPDLESHPHSDIEQGYGARDEADRPVRLRRQGERYFRTRKEGKGLVRVEEEQEISGEEFEQQWGATEGARVQKVRYEIPHGEYVIELDVYKGPLVGLITAEVEFTDEEDARQFEPPSWFGREVTEDSDYTNSALAQKGLPELEKRRLGMT